MTQPAQPAVCQWCRQLIPPRRVAWWDDRPQCDNPTACNRRMVKALAGGAA